MPASFIPAQSGNRSPQQVTDRLDGLIQKIYEIQDPCMLGEKSADVILVRPHRWYISLIFMHNLDILHDRSPNIFDVAAILHKTKYRSYQQHRIEEPAFFLGMRFPNREITT